MNDEDDATLIMLQQRSQLVLGLSVAAHYTKGRDRSGCRLQVAGRRSQIADLQVVVN